MPRPPRFGARNLAAGSPARQEGGRAAAAPHAGRFARRAQARVNAEARPRRVGARRRRASECERAPPGAQPWIPTTKCVGMTAGRGRPAPGAGRATPRQRRGCGRSGGGHPPSDAKRSEGQHQRREAPRLGGLSKGGRVAAAQRGRPIGGLDWSRQRGAGRPGYGGKRAQGGRLGRAMGA